MEDNIREQIKLSVKLMEELAITHRRAACDLERKIYDLNKLLRDDEDKKTTIKNN